MNKNDKIGLSGLLVIIVFATGFIIKACNYNAEKEKERGLSKLNEILSANGFRRCKRTLKKAE